MRHLSYDSIVAALQQTCSLPFDSRVDRGVVDVICIAGGEQCVVDAPEHARDRYARPLLTQPDHSSLKKYPHHRIFTPPVKQLLIQLPADKRFKIKHGRRHKTTRAASASASLGSF